MLRVDSALFSNVVTAVQRTGNLPGGAVRGLPNGLSVEGLRGVDSFAAEIADAKKEFELGRVHMAAQRIRQLEMQFSSIAGRWNATVSTIVSSARQGQQGLPLQKLNEVKNAQAKMRQLTGPATKTFRDLVTALEHVIAAGGHGPDVPLEQTRSTRPDATEAATPDDPDETATDQETKPPAAAAVSAAEDSPDISVLGKFADKYRFGAKLELTKGADHKRRISPKLEEGRFYFVQGLQPPTVLRIREIHSQSIIVFDALHSQEIKIDSIRLKSLIYRGIWLLVPWT